MDERKRILIFRRRMQLQRICVTICTGAMLLLCVGAISYFGNQDRHEDALLAREGNQLPRLKAVQERGRKVMGVCAGALFAVIGLSAGGFFLFWRCPECSFFFGLEFTPYQCPRCRALLSSPENKAN